MTTNQNQKWLKEYESFLTLETSVPNAVTASVFTQMQTFLRPSAWAVFAKLLAIHAVVGFLSLSVCHQFNMNPFQTEHSLSDWFMRMWGHSVCMIGCGITFVGISFLAAGYFLTIEEVKALRRTEFLQTLSMGLMSLAIFGFFGAELAITFAGLWLLGALFGGFVATEAIWKLKRLRFAKV